jgi:hypothetical protein
MPFHFIVAIGPYRSNSAGVRVMHRLCHLLNVIGQHATVATDVVNPAWNTPTAALISDETIAVYPEVVPGNPCGAKRVIRYVLNQPGLLGGTSYYDDNEMVFYYHERFREVAQAATREPLDRRRELPISVIEPDLFYHDRSLPRPYDCLYVGKGAHLREKYRLQYEDKVVTISSSYPTTRALTARLLQSCRTLFSYDDCTALLREALICGARVQLITADGTLTDWHEDISNYVAEYYDASAVERLVEQVEERWGQRPVAPLAPAAPVAPSLALATAGE